jgi:hypothetical protein
VDKREKAKISFNDQSEIMMQTDQMVDLSLLQTWYCRSGFQDEQVKVLEGDSPETRGGTSGETWNCGLCSKRNC